MSRDQATEIAAGNAAGDVGDATTRYLLYGLLPSWFVPGLADWVMHRRTRIEDTAGTKESLIHSLMMAEVGVPIALTLRYEINPLLLSVQVAGAAAHEATALWDVRTAVHSDREVGPVEQHIHSFLESLPFAALASLCACAPTRCGRWCGAGGAMRTRGGWCRGAGPFRRAIWRASRRDRHMRAAAVR